MKVETNLRAGGFFEDSAKVADGLLASANQFVKDASKQADVVVGTTLKTSTKLYNCMAKSTGTE